MHKLFVSTFLALSIAAYCSASNEITVTINVPTISDVESEHVRTSKISVDSDREFGSAGKGYLPFETGTGIFSLMMAYKNCKPKKDASLMEETIRKLVVGLKYRTNIDNQVSKQLETDANLLKARFESKKNYGERQFSIMEQLMAHAVGSAASTGVADIDKVMAAYAASVDLVTKTLPNVPLGEVSAAIAMEGDGEGKMIALVGNSAAWSADLCNQAVSRENEEWITEQRKQTFDMPDCVNTWVESKPSLASLPRVACVPGL